MPISNGENSEGWIFQAELFFEMNHLIEAKKMMAAEVSFEDEALAWYSWVDAQTPFSSRNGLKRQILDCFGSSQDGSLCDRFLDIKQTRTVVEYKRDYELMSTSMTRLPNEVLESTFIPTNKV